MDGWQKQYDGKFWLEPLLEEIAHIKTQKLIKQICGKEINYIALLSIKGKKGGFYNFRHEAGIKEDEEYFYKLFMYKNFFNKFIKLYNSYSINEHKFRKKFFSREKPNYFESKKLFLEGYALYRFTDIALLRKIENELKEVFKKRLKNKPDLIQDIMISPELNFIQQEEKLVLESALNYKDKRSIKSNLIKLQYQFGLIGYVRRNRSSGIAKFRKKVVDISKLTKKEIIIKLDYLNNYAQNINNRKKVIFKKYPFNSREIKLLNIVSTLAHIKLNLRNLWLPYYCEVHNNLKRIAKKNNLSKYTFESLRVNQFERYLKTKELPKDLNNKKCFLIFKEKKKSYIYYGRDAKKMIRVLDIPVILNKTDNLKGEIANKGLIKAKARVIHWDKYFKKGMADMKEGELLIVTQTKPDFMEAIRKASGIITNEGGLVSHAAIISRELGLPCLINTLHATEVFKTGDDLVLDCINGRVYKDDN